MKKIYLKRIYISLVSLVLALAMCFVVTGCKNGETAQPAPTKEKQISTSDEAKPVVYKSPEEIADAYLTACYKKFDAKEVVKVLDRRVLDIQFENAGTNYDDQIVMLQYLLDGQKKELEKAKATIEWEITGTEKPDDTALASLQKYYKELYKLDLESVTAVAFKSTKKAQGKEAETAESKVFVMEVDGKYYIDRNANTY